MNLRDAKQQLRYNIMAGNCGIMQSPPGIGKTDAKWDLVKWFANVLHKGKRVGYGESFMATQSEVGATGLPWKGELKVKHGEGERSFTVTDPAIPLWFMMTDVATGERMPASCFDVCFLCLEEWGQGSAETKKAFADVLLHGGTPPFYMPPGSARLALSNVDQTDGVTKEFDFIINRRSLVSVTGDVDVWIEDFADRPYQYAGREWNVMPVTKAWGKSHPTEFFSEKPKKQGPWATARSVTAWDRYAQCAMTENNGEVPINSSAFMEGSAGIVGMAATTSIFGHLQFEIELPKYEDIVAAPDTTSIPKKADLQLLLAYTLAHKVRAEHLGPVIQYMSRNSGENRLPKDMAVSFVTSMLRRDYAGLINQPAMQAWIAKNASLVSIIASLAQA